MRLKWTIGAGFLALCLLLSSCSKKQSDTQQQLAEAQKQLEEAQKKVQELEAKGGAEVEEAKKSVAAAQKAVADASKAAPGEKPAEQAKPEAPPPPPPPPPREFTVAAGTPLQVRSITSLSTKTAKAGDPFEATLTAPLIVEDYVIAAKGATVRGQVATSDPGGKVKGVASLSVALTALAGAHGESLAIRTQPVEQLAKSTKKKDAAKIGIGAGVGAAIGAIAGGGKGAAIGAGIGGAGGTGLVLATKGDPAVIPSESLLTFKLAAPVTVTEKK
jgi:hypothetical protein